MIKFLDCTLRDGGYYNNWDFSPSLIEKYLVAVQASGVDIIELGFRTLKNEGFKGACAFTKDDFIRSLCVPDECTLSVMVNAAELVGDVSLDKALGRLFPQSAPHSPVGLVRIACHSNEFRSVLPAANWLKNRGFKVGFNLMQVADLSESQIISLASSAKEYPIDVLYFADSMGSMTPGQVEDVIQRFRAEWSGPMGIHAHNNLGLALANSLLALDKGVVWVDSTVTGMGRGPGNTCTEELAIEVAERRCVNINLVALSKLVRENFKPMQKEYGWGTNLYYYLAGKYGIHPSYIQEMLNISCYEEEDILAIIEQLKSQGGKKFNNDALEGARIFYRGQPKGEWSPRQMFFEREVLLLGSGPGVANHRAAIEKFIRTKQPLVVAVNTQADIDSVLIDLRIACHPVRLLADCRMHIQSSQPLITPFSMLPLALQNELGSKEVLDFGMAVENDRFICESYHCTVPKSLVAAYALATASSGRAKHVFVAGFDGYSLDDPRHEEMATMLNCYTSNASAVPITAITPTNFNVNTISVYGIC